MTQLTLSLDAPVSRPRRSVELHRLIQVLPKHEADPRKRGDRALRLYVDRFGHMPREIICHPLDAVEIGEEVQGIPVISTGLSRYLFHVGRLEI